MGKASEEWRTSDHPLVLGGGRLNPEGLGYKEIDQARSFKFKWNDTRMNEDSDRFATVLQALITLSRGTVSLGAGGA